MPPVAISGSSTSTKIMNDQKNSLPVYDAEKHPFYRYTMQRLPVYDAEITGIRCRVSSSKNESGDSKRSYENHKRSHETETFRPMPYGGERSLANSAS